MEMENVDTYEDISHSFKQPISQHHLHRQDINNFFDQINFRNSNNISSEPIDYPIQEDPDSKTTNFSSYNSNTHINYPNNTIIKNKLNTLDDSKQDNTQNVMNRIYFNFPQQKDHNNFTNLPPLYDSTPKISMNNRNNKNECNKTEGDQNVRTQNDRTQNDRTQNDRTISELHSNEHYIKINKNFNNKNSEGLTNNRDNNKEEKNSDNNNSKNRNVSKNGNKIDRNPERKEHEQIITNDVKNEKNKKKQKNQKNTTNQNSLNTKNMTGSRNGTETQVPKTLPEINSPKSNLNEENKTDNKTINLLQEQKNATTQNNIYDTEDTKRPDALRDKCWQYIDPKGVVQGPFFLEEMRMWSELGYFEPMLPVRCCDSDRFIALNKLFPPPHKPFTIVPKPQPILQWEEELP